MESATYALLAEWLGQWFDGGTHTLGTQPARVWPLVQPSFGQGPIQQPLQGSIEIRVVMQPRAEAMSTVDTSMYAGKQILDYVTLNFWIRAKMTGRGQSQLQARTVGELLKALLTHPDSRYLLAQKGVHHLQPQGPATPMPSTEWAERLMVCAAQLHYPVSFGPDAPLPPERPGFTYEVLFYEADPVLAGDYLLGTYRWSAPMRLSGMRAVGWASQTAGVTLGLEVNGVLTGDTVTLPVGEPNVEVQATAAVNLEIDPGAIVRVKVLAAPDAVDTAWHVSLSLAVAPACACFRFPPQPGNG